MFHLSGASGPCPAVPGLRLQPVVSPVRAAGARRAAHPGHAVGADPPPAHPDVQRPLQGPSSDRATGH